MAAPEITSDGVVIQTYDDIFTELSDGYKAIYGDDIDLSPESPDGQRIGIEAKAILDAQTGILTLSNNFDPELASASWLERVCKFAGITRQAATRSAWTIRVTTDRNLTIPAGFKIEDSIGQKWQTVTSTRATTGNNNVSFQAVTFGAIVGLSSYTFTQVERIVGITAITALADATVGVDEETDTALRIRRNESLENPARTTIGNIYAALSAVNGVTDLVVYENATATTNNTLSLAPHSVWCIIKGGTAANIASALIRSKSAGCAMKGDVSQTFTETLSRPGGGTFVVSHTAKFDRPDEVAVHVRMDASRKIASSSIDTAAIKAAIAALKTKIGQNIYTSELYATAYSAGTNFYLSNLEISSDGTTYVDTLLASAVDGLFTFDVNDIDITEV